MGIKGLWSVLSSASEKLDLREARGSRVAVDLSGWIVENSKATTGISKPHIRNLFFRCSALISLGIHPVFVMDPSLAPSLKLETLAARRNDQEPTNDKPVSLRRNRLGALLKECRALLESMGLPSVQSPGEAEGLCASMNVDAIITEDSDVFCYGEDFVVWRNFSVSGGKSYCVEKHDTRRIRRLLGLSRDRMVFLALMLGCDFFPTGVTGVGKETVMALFQNLDSEWNAISMLEEWIRTDFALTNPPSCTVKECLPDNRCCSDCFLKSGACRCVRLREKPEIIKAENAIKKKCLKMETNFWNEYYLKIIQEFWRFPKKEETFYEKPPEIKNVVSILVKKLNWEIEYSFQKSLPILTRWQISSSRPDRILRLESVIKKRTVDGIPSLEVLWEFCEDNNEFNKYEIITVEPLELLRSYDPQKIDGYFEDLEALKENKKPKKKAKTKKVKDLATISQFLKNIKETDDKNIHPKSHELSTQFLTKSVNEKVLVTPKRSDANSSEYSDSDEDLSLIIEDILSKKISGVRLNNPPLVTSTPFTGSRERHRLTKSSVKSEIQKKSSDSEEDSFDRMCQPNDWKKL